MQETWVQTLGLEDPLEKGMATHSSILAGKTPWTEKPGGYSPWGGERVGNNLATKYQQQLTEDNLFHEEADFLLRVIGSGPGSEQSSEKKSSSVVVPTFLVPETGFVEDNFSTMAGGWLRW